MDIHQASDLSDEQLVQIKTLREGYSDPPTMGDFFGDINQIPGITLVIKLNFDPAYESYRAGFTLVEQTKMIASIINEIIARIGPLALGQSL